ncbi:MAG TPA: DUF4197 domain-containing protein [Chitinophagaceae bacterium]|nr:DUF4197 domain-containing protein [Chitinophagaceae bacterium]
MKWLLLILPLCLRIGIPSGTRIAGDFPAAIPDSLVARGLRQALEVGAENASRQLSAENGYYGNPAVKILLPPEAAKVEITLSRMGMGSLVDHAVLAMNRAAEQAAKSAAPIFLQAIRRMQISDAVHILTGGPHAATDYLQKTTTPALTAAFHPVIDSCLEKTGATRYWTQVFSTYNRIPFTRKVNPNLGVYVTEKALDGLFYNIGLEEQKIRMDPAAQVSSLLRTVFGNR